MMDDGLRTRTKGMPGGNSVVDLEGGSPRKHHGLAHNFGGSVSSHQARRLQTKDSMNGSQKKSLHFWQELEAPFFKALTSNLLVAGAIASFVLFWLAGLCFSDTFF